MKYISEFSPISLIHNITKIITKATVNRLLPHTNSLMSHAEGALIKKEEHTWNLFVSSDLSKKAPPLQETGAPFQIRHQKTDRVHVLGLHS
jgi:hypothetical protein